MEGFHNEIQGIPGGIMKFTVVLAAFISLVLSSGAFAGERYLVVMKSNQSADTAYKAFSRKTDKGFLNGFFTKESDFSKVEAKVVENLANLNTIVVDADAAEIAKLQNNPDVAMVEKEIFHPAPQPMNGFVVTSKKNKKTFASVLAVPAQPWGIAAVKAPEAWVASPNKGAGARVLVLDTGIDAEHPSLKVNFEKGQDFTGLSNGSDFTDRIGHGTHCSGTIAGVENASGFTGVAPQAKILMGRVCAENGCSNIAIARGISWGIAENVDVISMSLGGMFSTPAERSAIAFADQMGITIVAASGNNGTGVVSYPAALPTVIAVGAVDSKLEKAAFSQFGPELAIVAPGVDVVSSVPVGSGRESEVYVSVQGVAKKVVSSTFQGVKESTAAVDTELVYAGLGKPEDFAAINVAGKFALVSRGEIMFADKVKNAIAAKAAGVIIYNNAPGLISGAVTQDGSILDIYAAMVEQSVGEELKAELDNGHPAMASILTLKTDYSSFQGTSMATPHVAGVVALMKAAKKSLRPADVKSILQKTAQPLMGPNANNELGAGLVNAEAAVNAALGK
jgi:serine protease